MQNCGGALAIRCCVLGLLTAVAGGCGGSPRGEYMQTRTVEVRPTNGGDGSLLSQRDQILRGDLATTKPVQPLAAVKSDDTAGPQ